MRTLNRSVIRSFVVIVFLCVVTLSWPSRAEAQTATFKVYITELWQLGIIDPGFGLIGDFYAKVTINGVEHNNRGACDDTSILPGLMTPFNLFKNFEAIDECRHARTPWTFVQEVPTNEPVHVKIQIFDVDLIFDDEADLKPGDGKSLELVVNRNTGQWSGDLTWPQPCSRPTNAATSDSDVNVCVQIGFDSDDDGLLDVWEMFGVDTDNDGVIDVPLPALSAHPFRKDVFLEIDHLLATSHSHQPRQLAIERAVKAFADAPVSNPDGTAGIQLHVDTGPLFGAGMRTSIPGTGGAIGVYGDLGGGNSIGEAGNEIIAAFLVAPGDATTFASLKAANFDALREPIFRYTIFGHQTNSRLTFNDCTSGEASLTRRDFLVTLGGIRFPGKLCWGADDNGFSVGSITEQAGTLMHELGHTLGLRHGGNDEILRKPNYLSVMNYALQDCRIAPSPGLLPGGCDYSRLVQGSLVPPLNEVDLDECVGLGGGLGFGSVDWNKNGVFEGATACGPIATNAIADLNRDGVCITAGANKALNTTPLADDLINDGVLGSGPNRVCDTPAAGDDIQVTAVGSMPTQPNPLKSFDDWGSVTPGLIGFTSGFGLGANPEPEATPEMMEEARRVMAEMMTPGITLDQTGPATGKPGDVLIYTVKVENNGRGPAVAALLEETNPDGAARATDLGIIAVGAQLSQASLFTVPAEACPGDFTAARAALAYKDFPGNDFLAADTTPLQILDVTAPSVALTLSPEGLWAPNHKFRVVTATLVVTDNCDPNPAVTLVSITSNEPATGAIGEGDKGPDVQDAAFGTDDRTFALRAERETGQGSTGRVYTVTYRVTDVSGNTTETTATVTVATSNSGR